MKMSFAHCGLGRALLLFGLVVFVCSAHAGPEFPFDREMILQAKPIRPGKRLPILTVEPSGNATIDLWCKTVSARVELSADALRISAAPLPDALPEMLAPGQCTPERIAADEATLMALTQATAWRRRGEGVELIGPQNLLFRPASN